MVIRRRWIANCDTEGCREVVVLEGDQHDGRWALGVDISDLGWDAAPNREATHCPRHSKATPDG